MVTVISNSPEETAALGERWAQTATAGMVIAVSGDLGTGKTQLAKGIARGLGYTGHVHSPTFALLNLYEGGRMPFYHLDLYRLEGVDQVIAAGLEDYLEPDGIALIEWAERWFGETNQPGPDPTRLHLKLRRVKMETLNENVRRIDYEDFGL